MSQINYKELIAMLGRDFNEVEIARLDEVSQIHGNNGHLVYIMQYLVLLNNLKSQGYDVSDEQHLENFQYLWDIRVNQLRQESQLKKEQQIGQLLNGQEL